MLLPPLDMLRSGSLLPLALVTGALATSCGDAPSPEGGDMAESCDPAAAREVVERLGESMKRVSLLGPDSVVARWLEEAYAPLVTPELLRTWRSEPSLAPGRLTSSPWPERVEVRSIEGVEAGGCRVEGTIVYVTSVEATRGSATARQPVELRVTGRGGWRVAAYRTTGPLERWSAPADSATPAPPPRDASADAAGAADVVRRYYEAIASGDYRRAYEMWSDGGGASGQTFDHFAEGFAETASVEAAIGEPGRVEPAAGSRWVRVPVVVRAVTSDGEAQRFEGTYALRRAVVPGAPEEERRWRIASADVTQTR